VYRRGCTPLIRGVVAKVTLGDGNSRRLSGVGSSFLSTWHSQQLPATMGENKSVSSLKNHITASEVHDRRRGKIKMYVWILIGFAVMSKSRQRGKSTHVLEAAHEIIKNAHAR